MKYLDLKEAILRILKQREDVLSVMVQQDGTFHLNTTTGPVSFKLILPDSLDNAALPN